MRNGLIMFVLACGACSGSEPVHIPMPIQVDPAGVVPVVNDLGYMITTTKYRTLLGNFAFTVGGETHVAARRRARAFRNLLIGNAWAHPGHLSNGVVTGELRGRFIIDSSAPAT